LGFTTEPEYVLFLETSHQCLPFSEGVRVHWVNAVCPDTNT
jgi:hypothetical protein